MQGAVFPRLVIYVLIVIIPLLPKVGISGSTSLEDDIRTADQSFNHGDTPEALAIYLRVHRTLEQTNPLDPLRSEVLNNIAAAHVVEGKPPGISKEILLWLKASNSSLVSRHHSSKQRRHPDSFWLMAVSRKAWFFLGDWALRAL